MLSIFTDNSSDLASIIDREQLSPVFRVDEISATAPEEGALADLTELSDAPQPTKCSTQKIVIA